MYALVKVENAINEIIDYKAGGESSVYVLETRKKELIEVIRMELERDRQAERERMQREFAAAQNIVAKADSASESEIVISGDYVRVSRRNSTQKQGLDSRDILYRVLVLPMAFYGLVSLIIAMAK